MRLNTKDVLEGAAIPAALVALLGALAISIYKGDQAAKAAYTHAARVEFQKEAIEHNAAEYVCDPATGATEFRWKEADHAR